MPNLIRLQKNALTTVLLVASILFGKASLAGSAETVEHYGMSVSLNANTFECLACHDNIIARMGDFQLLRFQSKPNPLGSHPVNITYPAELSESEKLASITDITAAGFRLLDGKVVCITCHDLRLTSENFLPVPTTGSKICFACHKI